MREHTFVSFHSSGADVSCQATPASLQSVLNKTGSEAGRTRRFQPAAAGGFGARLVQARVCGAAVAARGPRAERRRGAAAGPAEGAPCRAAPSALRPRRRGPPAAPAGPPAPHPHLVPQVTPAAAPGARHPAPGSRCCVLRRLPRHNQEPEEGRPEPPPRHGPRGRAEFPGTPAPRASSGYRSVRLKDSVSPS